MNLNDEIKKLNEIQGSLKPVLKDEVYYFLRRVENILSSVCKASPFQVGDIVKLNETPEINEHKSWGWLGAKHFLVKGAEAEVRVIDWNCSIDNYCYGLWFHNESYIHFQTKEVIPVEKKGLYYFGLNWIDRVE